MMVLAVVPVFAIAEMHREVPESYDEYEYNKMAAFLRLEDADGVTNASKL